MKLTPENASSKLGKKLDLETTEELSLPNKQFTEIGSLSRFSNLKQLDLRFQFERQITGLYDLSNSLISLNLSGNPICKIKNYRETIISNLANLQNLDGIDITPSERETALNVKNESNQIFDPLMNVSSSEEEERQQQKEEQERMLKEKEDKERQDEELQLKKQKEIEEKKKKDYLEFVANQKEETEKQQKEEEKKKKENEEKRQKLLEEQLSKEKEIQYNNNKNKKKISPEKETKKKVENTKKEEDGTGVEELVDARSGIKISNLLTSGKNLSVKNQKKNSINQDLFKPDVLDTDSLFSVDEPITLDIEKEDVDKKDLFDVDGDDLFSNFDKKIEQKKKTPLKKPIISDNDDDLFSSPNPNTLKLDDDDEDLFSFGNNDSNSSLDSNIDIASYIESQKSGQESKGLFD